MGLLESRAYSVIVVIVKRLGLISDEALSFHINTLKKKKKKNAARVARNSSSLFCLNSASFGFTLPHSIQTQVDLDSDIDSDIDL